MFVFGSVEELGWGSALFLLRTKAIKPGEFVVGGSDLLLIAIPPGMKATVMDETRPIVRELFGYDARSLFPDIEGFSGFHGADQGFGAMFIHE